MSPLLKASNTQAVQVFAIQYHNPINGHQSPHSAIKIRFPWNSL
jgi:hypothetical protein